MEAIGHRLKAAVLVVLLALFALPARADRAADVLATVNHVASALTDDNAPDAMTVFDKSFPDYDKLSGYFGALTDRGLLINEVNVIEEQDSDAETVLTVEWALTITAKRFSGDTERRVQQVHVKLRPDKKKWKIVEFSPITLFDPAPQSNSRK
jgi:hypothetical protein